MIHEEWKKFFLEEIHKPYFDEIFKNLDEEEQLGDIFPCAEDVFRVFDYPLSNVKIVIIGQDPYHEKGQAMGLAFSVNDGVKIPPSLGNIYKELKKEGFNPDCSTGNLTKWAEQGVFLLNSILTVREGRANSHSKVGWEVLTDAVIRLLDSDNSPKAFMLWGSFAQKKKCFITNPIHKILKASHPSPLSVYRGFYGCNHFKLANEFLEENGLKKIEW